VGNDGQKFVLHVQPFTAKDFSTRSLSDRIRDFDDLTILYPNKPKNEAFGKYTIAAGRPKNKDYVQSEIRAVLPTIKANAGVFSNLNTMASFQNMQSLDSSRDSSSVQSG
jgi:signal transducer and activator of transcription 5B